ncbi:MAG: hypothetical protein V4700_02285 [Pseudomonadota bacterium]
MKLFILLLSLLFSLVGCTSVNNYIKTRKSQYLYSQDFGPLKTPKNLKIGQTSYIIPAATSVKSTQLPNLYPPTD